MPLFIRVGARTSPLSRAQVAEVSRELRVVVPSLVLVPHYVTTCGDRDRTTSLRYLDKSDFFTRDVDALLLNDSCRLAIHSAKDLPDPLPNGLRLVALTRGVDASDSVVVRLGGIPKKTEGLVFDGVGQPTNLSPPALLNFLSLAASAPTSFGSNSGCLLVNNPSFRLFGYIRQGARIATSSLRREAQVRALYPDSEIVDIRGSIHERLALLDQGMVDGVVVAEAALIRLQLTHLPRIRLPGPTAPLQGRLALLAREGDEAMITLCRPLHYEEEKNPLLGARS